MYKDENKQKEANRDANKRYREKVSREGITEQGITPNSESKNVIPKKMTFSDLPLDVQHDIERVSRNPTVGMTVEEEKAKRTVAAIKYHNEHPNSQHKGIDLDMVAEELKQGELNRVSKLGDTDYREHTGAEERCRYCNSLLSRLERPRRRAGACIGCIAKVV